MLLVRGILPIGLIVLLASCRPADESGPMTVEKFRKITGSPGDNVPLQPMLAKVPWWSNTVTSEVMTNFDPTTIKKVSQDVLHAKARTVKGKYIIFSTAQPGFSDRNTIWTYDERSSAYKFYFPSGTGLSVVEGTTVYDFTNKTYSYKTAFDGYKVIGHGSYSNAHLSETSLMYSDNRLFLITVQETEAVP